MGILDRFRPSRHLAKTPRRVPTQHIAAAQVGPCASATGWVTGEIIKVIGGLEAPAPNHGSPS